MPRIPRIEFSGAFYHVISRGNNRGLIFKDTTDYMEFLNSIEITKGRYEFTLYGYSLLPNHFHLIIETVGEPLSIIMRSLLTRYAHYFNKRYKRVGHVFQERYKAILCQKDNYLLELVRYIHLNPVRASIVSNPSEWRWSSHLSYIGLEKNNIVDIDNVLGHFSTRRNDARNKYDKFIREGLKQDYRKDLYPRKKFPCLGEKEFLEEINKKQKEVRRRDEVLNRNSIDDWAERISKTLKIDKNDIKSPQATRELSFAREILSYLSVYYSSHKITKVAKYLNRSISTITMSLRRIRERISNDKSINGIIQQIVNL